ncbi:MAG: signal peptidase II [Frankiaceae bacterium]
MQAARGASLSEPDRAGRPAASHQPSARTVGLLTVVAVVVLVADLISKIEIVRHLEPGAYVDVVDGVLRLTQARNPGAAFSIGTGQTALFALVAVAVIVAIVRTARRLSSTGWAVTLGLLLGGALGNLIDRVFRAPAPFRGYVVDWIKLPHWPIFNLADSAIVCGGALAVLLAARGIDVDGRRRDPGLPGDAEHAGDGDASAYSERD